MQSAPAKHTPYFELLEALAQPGCAICSLMLKASARYLHFLLYENVNDPGLRERLRASLGFCNRHFWQLHEGHAPGLGVAIIAKDVLGTALAALRTHGPGGEHPKLRARALAPRDPCPVCTVEEHATNDYLDVLLEHLEEKDFQRRVSDSQGLCIPHLRRALLRASPQVGSKLASLQYAIWERLRAELETFIEKHDYRHQGEGFGAEADSWIRAIEALAGNATHKHARR